MKLGRYTLLDELGQGAMGTVYRAHDPLIERDLAIKTVALSRLQEEGADAARFLNEARSAGRLTHPGIVTIYDVGETAETAYIAMELIDGPSLRATLDTSRLAVVEALDMACQLAEALAFAHGKGVIHRDIKPGNVLLARANRVKLTDFGIAIQADYSQTRAGAMQGSPRYMSPEQAMGKPLTPRTDIFSFGALLYEMLTGRFAFDADTLPGILQCVLDETPPTPDSLRGDLPDGLSSLTLQMLAKAPEARPDADDVLDALLDIRAPQAAKPVVFKPRHRVLAIALPVALTVFGGGTVALLYTLDQRPLPPQPATTRALPDTTPATAPPLLDPVPLRAGVTAPPLPEPVSVSEAPIQVERAEAPFPAAALMTAHQQKRLELEKKRLDLLLRFTPDHPDVRLIDLQLEQLDKKPPMPH